MTRLELRANESDVMGSHQAGAYTLCLSLRATSLKATGKSRRAALALDQTPLIGPDRRHKRKRIGSTTILICARVLVCIGSLFSCSP